MLGEWKRLDRLAEEAGLRGEPDEEDRLHHVAIEHLEDTVADIPRGTFEIVRLCCVARWLAAHGDLDAALSAHVQLALRHVVVAARAGSPELPRLLAFLDVLPVEVDWFLRSALMSLSSAPPWLALMDNTVWPV